MDQKEQKIIQGSSEIFMRFGVKGVNMDDVAGKLGISKKTLYKYVKDKNDLLHKAMQMYCEMEDESINAICALNLNAIDENFEISRFIISILKQVHPSVHFDLEKYHPEVFKFMMENRQASVFKCVFENLEKGKHEGLYRDDINASVIAKIYLSKMDVMFDSRVFRPEDISFSEVYLEFFRYHIHGIASDKGRKYLIKKMEHGLS